MRSASSTRRARVLSSLGEPDRHIVVATLPLSRSTGCTFADPLPHPDTAAWSTAATGRKNRNWRSSSYVGSGDRDTRPRPRGRYCTGRDPPGRAAVGHRLGLEHGLSPGAGKGRIHRDGPRGSDSRDQLGHHKTALTAPSHRQMSESVRTRRRGGGWFGSSSRAR